jgi:hypothetical protein
MAKWLTLWEVDTSRTPTDPKERAALWGKQVEATKKMLAEGQILDWGLFAGGGGGYSIAEGTEADALKRILQFSPYIKFKVQPVLPIDAVAEVLQSLMG